MNAVDSFNIRVNGLSEVLHILHQIDGPVGQLFRDLSVREHPHELEDEFIFSCTHGNRLVQSLPVCSILKILALHVCLFF